MKKVDDMKKILSILLLCMFCSLSLHAGTTIEECVRKAESNYPLIRKYDLLNATTDIELSDIDKSWLPRIGVYGQLTGQNIVPSFPESLTGMLQQMGQEMSGLGKLQYKVGVDISQTIWDGGVSRSRRRLVRSRDAVQKTALDVDLYTVRQRVENLYFAILLTEEQIAQNRITYDLLLHDLEKLRAMLNNGTAMQSDLDMVEAKTLIINQGILQAQSAARGYRAVLGIFIGESLDGVTLDRPVAEMPSSLEPDRPELRLFDQQLSANQLSVRLSDTSLMPKIGFFGQSYYGYPGFNYFRSMMRRDLSFNIMAGLKVSWNIDSFYAKKNNSRRAAINADNINTDRELFLFTNRMQFASQLETIDGLRSLMKDDARILELRANVRRAAESQLENGIIDATALLTKISEENIAALTARLHEIQLLQEIYKLKYTLNR